jgi:hypothetical protein
MVTLLTFIVLGGGTAFASFVINSNADVAPDTISGHVPPAGDHSNLISGSVGSADLALGSVTGANVLDKSLTSADLRDVAFQQAKTEVLSTGGGGTMFTVGRVKLASFCTLNGNTLSAGIEPVVTRSGPVLVEGTSLTQLQPFDVEFVVVVGNNLGVAARETSFAILDPGFVSVSGDAAARVDPHRGTCTVTVQAEG